MKITHSDLERWRENTLNLARKISLDEKVLENLEKTLLVVIDEDSYPHFYGESHYFLKIIGVYESNPSKYFPKKVQEAWNQSGMDHELIGHMYNYIAGLKYDEEAARKTQLQMIKLRSKQDPLWNLASFILNPLLKFKDKRNKNL